MKTFFHYVMTDHDARILFVLMLVCAIFALGVFGWVALRATRPIRLKRRAARQHERAVRRQKRTFKKMQKTGQITNAAARTKARQNRDWGREAHEKFGGISAGDQQNNVQRDELENTGELVSVPTRK